MGRNVFLLVVVVNLVVQCFGFPTGPPTAACRSMMPLHRNALSNDLQYGLELLRGAEFAPNGLVEVGMRGPSNFRGLFLQVRNGADTAVGEWDIGLSSQPQYYKNINCLGPKSALGHNSRTDKRTSEQRFSWRAPSDCVDGSQYVLRGTVVEQLVRFQTGIQMTLTCRKSQPSPLPVTFSVQPPPLPVTPSFRPPPPLLTPSVQPPILPVTPTIPPFSLPLVSSTQPQPITIGSTCNYISLNSIPAGYNTNFEDANNYLSLWQSTSDGTYAWGRGSGYTPSFLTGPTRANEGTYYLYVESSSPAQPNYQATLSTAKNLRGCFCLQMAVSHRIRARSNHALTVQVGGVTLLTVNGESNGWEEQRIQVDVPNFVQVVITATRGSNWLGDFALDNIRITSGACPS